MKCCPPALLCAIACLLSVTPASAASHSSLREAPKASSLAGRTTPLGKGTSLSRTTNPEAPVPIGRSNVPPPGRRLSSNEAIAIAAKVGKVRAERAKYPGSYPGAYLKGPLHWQVSWFSRKSQKEIAQVILDDSDGRVLEAWTGFQVAWTMARGYKGAFGRHVNALYIWLPLCLFFIAPFFDFRRPLKMLNLDLLVLVSFSVSLAFFNHADVYQSVPLSYPPLLYLLARMLALLRRRPGASGPGPLRLRVPVGWLALGVVFLLGFRIALNVTDSNVIDVGYAGVIGAERITHDEALYGGYPSDNEHGDTYGPFNYEAYVPFEEIFGFSGKWDDLPAAHAAAVFFDLIAVALLFLLGRRMRGPTLGVVLAYGWVAYPFTLFSLESNTNDTLVGALVLAALLAASYSGKLARAGGGAATALAGLTKLAPLALAPLLATNSLRGASRKRRPSLYALFLAGFALAAAVVFVPALTHDSLHEIYERTLAYQDNRGSPFSVWGLYGWHGAENVVEAAAVVLALALAVLPRREDLVGLAAACAAVLIASQLAIEHWFYLYIPWFFPLVLVALFGRFSDPRQAQPPVAASAPALASRPEVAMSS
ncbi:MAG TPA: hypothetical protein VGG08_07690 [Solirubrobacteraceae bacterium]|jgi:hypothetical protein